MIICTPTKENLEATKKLSTEELKQLRADFEARRVEAEDEEAD
jgi:hypothetical protein